MNMIPSGRRDPAAIDRILDDMFAREPAPHVYANDDRGLMVPMPPTVPVRPENVVTGHASVFEILVPADAPGIISAWHEALATGAATTTIHLLEAPNDPATLHLIDARHRFGVWLVFILGAGLAGRTGKVPHMFRRRLCSFDRDARAVVTRIDDATTEVLGYSAAEFIGLGTIEITHPDDKASAVANWMTMLGRPGSHARTIMRYRHRDASWHWFEVTLDNRLDDAANPRVVSELIDITDRMAAQEALRASEQLHRHLTESLPMGIVQIDAARTVVYRNARLSRIVGRADATTLDEQFANVVPDHRTAFADAVTAILTTGHVVDIELSVQNADGLRRCNLGMRALTAESGAINGAIIWVADITDPARLREELVIRATYDALTHCHNRASILPLLEGVLQAPRETHIGTAVMFIDLNRFKEINDQLGHDAGDELLRQTGKRLLGAARIGDVVGRLGGDEFLVICPDVATPEVARTIADRLDMALREPVVINMVPIAPSASIGVAWTMTATTADALVASADRAMYESKRGRLGPVLSPA